MTKNNSLLEISVAQTDRGKLVGKAPKDIPMEILTQKFRAKTPLKALRARCLDCCCGDASEVRKCTATDCASWPFRLRTDPFRKKATLSDDEKRRRADRLRSVQQNKAPAGAVNSGAEADIQSPSTCNESDLND